MRRLLVGLALAFALSAQTPEPSPFASGSGGGGGGTPGGSTTQCQYNNSGAFGGITGCTTNGTTVTLASPIVTGTLTIGTAVSVDGTTGIATSSKVGNVALSGLSGIGKWTAGVPSTGLAADIIALWSGTCNSSSVLVGDGTCGAVSSAYTSITGVPANSLLGNNTGSTANAISLTALPFVVTAATGGSGVNNGSFTETRSGNVTYTGAFNPTFAIPSSSTWSFPSGGGTILISGGALGTPSSGTLTNATGLPAAGVVGTAAVLGANTFTGAQTLTVNGALSAPGHTGTGTWITGGSATTTKPYWLIETTGASSAAWNTNGTGFGVNAASGFTGMLADFQLNGVSKLTISSGGNISSAGSLSASTDVTAGGGNGFKFSSKSQIASSANGKLQFMTASASGFTSLTLGLETASFPQFLVTSQTNPILACVDGTGANTCQIKANAYLSSDGSAGVTGSTCTAWKNGLCTTP